MARRRSRLLVFVALLAVVGFYWLSQRPTVVTEVLKPPAARATAQPTPSVPRAAEAPTAPVADAPKVPVADAPKVPVADAPWESAGTLTENGEALALEKRGDERRLVRRDGSTLELFTEIAGRREGTSTRWFPSGNVLSTGLWRAGKQEGTWTYFQDDGSIAQKGEFVGGAREGTWESWYANGLLRWRGTYEQGRQVGLWSFIQPTGEVDTAQTGRYENGKKVGN